MEFTRETLAELGISFPPAEEVRLLAEMNAALERNVDKEVFGLLGWSKGRELRRLVADGDEPAIDAWLAANASWRGEVAEDAYNIMLGDLVVGVTDFRKWDVDTSAR